MNSEFWIQRIKEHGHTGWSDNLTYVYDQKIRLLLLETIISKYFKNGIDKALDYGCGSGDFTNLMDKYSNSVIGVDIASEIIEVAREKYPSILFDKIDNYKKNKYNFIISITVLQHFLDDNNLKNVLFELNNALEEGGIMVIVDSYSNNEESNKYLKLRKYNNFLGLVESNNFQVLESHNLYHPQSMPTKLYWLYRNSMVIKILNKLKFNFLINKIAYFIASFDSPLVLKESSTKLIILRKR